jgi:uncharacterized protein (TIGR03000 family)
MIRKSFVLALIGGVVLAVSSATANAGWWHHGSGGSSGSYGSSGGYGSSGSYGGWGSSGSNGYYGSSGGWGSSGGYGSSGSYGSSGGSSGGHRHGLFGHKHRAYYGGSSGSSGYSSYYSGSSGSSGYTYSYGYGSSGGSSGGYYSSGYGSSYGSTGGVISGEVYSTPGTIVPSTSVPSTAPAMPTPPPVPMNPGSVVPPPAAGAFYSPVENGTAAIISVNVPAGAKVFVNGNATTSTGTARQYISRGLRAGQLYSYEFRLEAEVDGRLVTETKSIQVTGGQRAELAFNASAEAPVVGKTEKPAANKTTLILNVPADAKVTLSGSETQQTGPVREFSTDKLVAGEKWENYVVRVETTIDGQLVVAEKTVTVNAGEQRELSFDLSANAVTRTASR